MPLDALAPEAIAFTPRSAANFENDSAIGQRGSRLDTDHAGNTSAQHVSGGV